MKKFKTANGSDGFICEDGYIRVESITGLVYDGYYNEGVVSCPSPLGRIVLKNALDFYHSTNF